MVISIDDYGASISRRNSSFLIEKQGESRQISPLRVTAIHIRKGCDLSSPAILLAAEHEIPVLFFSAKGKVEARLWRPHFGSLAEVRRRQLYWADQAEGLGWAVEAILKKSEGQLQLLLWLGNRVPSRQEDLAEAGEAMQAWMARLREFAHVAAEAGEAAPQLAGPDLRQEIRAAEAQISRIYWERFFEALERYEKADKRSRRPAKDPLNALLNYGYGMLYGEVEGATLTAGLDPHIGILHRETYNRPAFVFDAIEPYRPWVDRLVAELAISGEIKSAWFEVEDDKVWLAREGKRTFIERWLGMMLEATAFRGRRIKRKDQVQLALTRLAQSFLADDKEEQL